MGKGKRTKHDGPTKQRPIHERLTKGSGPLKPAKPQKTKGPKPAPNPTQGNFNPFSNPEHTVLLVGEGDFSFSKSLIDEHGCFKMVCTSFDDKETVLEKYPQAGEIVDYLTGEEQTVLHGIDATKLAKTKQLRGKTFDRIVFMFPHVGGISKDVDRQIRANQELLLKFFENSIPLLAIGGKICVTLFEGKPYDEWDIRTLAKTAKLKSFRSCKFNWSDYPGYHHMRTLGNLESGWKGEERDARLYVFEENDGSKPGQKRKRKMGDDDSSDEE